MRTRPSGLNLTLSQLMGAKKHSDVEQLERQTDRWLQESNSTPLIPPNSR